MDRDNYVPKADYILLMAEKKDLENHIELLQSENPIASLDGPLKYAVLQAIGELTQSLKQYGPFGSYHEALGVIREEYLELEREVFKKPHKREPVKIMTEARQLAAVAMCLMTGMVKNAGAK